MQTKRIVKLFKWLIVSMALLVVLCGTSMAADESRSYQFEITVNEQDSVEVVPGNIVTATVRLRRTDSDEPATIYAMQTEIRYNSDFLEIVDGGTLLATGVDTTDISLQGNERALYLSFVSFSGGETWEADTVLGTIQMRILSESGSDTLFLENSSVSLPDGSDTYKVDSKSLTLIVTTDCTITFEPNNGEPASQMVLGLGEKIPYPESPEKDGYYFTGWYSNAALSEPWDFNQDTVTGNMTLYAGWSMYAADGVDTGIDSKDIAEQHNNHVFVTVLIVSLSLLAIGMLILLCTPRYIVKFNSCGGTEIPAVKVRRGRLVKRPEMPIKDGYEFTGWYKNISCTERWRFSHEKVKLNVTLYAGWSKEQHYR